MEQYSDQVLIEMFHKSESRNYAFNLIVQKYQQKIYWHVRRMVIDHDDTNDLVQNIFVKAWKGLDKFREDAAIFSWLYRIATNEVLNFLNHKRRKLFIPMHNVEKELSEKMEDDRFFNGDEIQKKLQKAILTLPEKQRIVFNMKYFDEVTYEQMSEILGTSVGALKASYHLAVKKIEKFVTSG